jgi:hypothetical protein
MRGSMLVVLQGHVCGEGRRKKQIKEIKAEREKK